jgi:hypothetical protein
VEGVKLAAPFVFLALLVASTALAAGPAVGGYSGKATGAAPAKPHSISFKVAKCAKGYCATFSTSSFVQALCSESGFYYDAFFPIATPIAVSPTGKISVVIPLYVADEESYGTPGPGRKKAGSFQLALAVGAGTATGTERYKVNLGAGDGLCDSGDVAISAQRG